MRICLDTNVLLSGFGTRGLCEVLVSICIASHRLIVSDFIMLETSRYLTMKLKVPPAHAEEILAFLKRNADVVVPIDVHPGACRDRDDLPILGTALAGRAGVLVTGDKDLLVLEHFQGIEILSPRACYERIRR